MQHPYTHPHPHSRGFTLVELSVVLVIIALIIGSVFVGQDLIRAAAVRAQIAQIDKYQAAVAAFDAKYGALPGDMNAAKATAFNFPTARGAYYGEGDGNGMLEGVWENAQYANFGSAQGFGETSTFWVDLSYAGMIDSNFTTATEYVQLSGAITGTNLAAYFPAAKIGHGGYVYVWSDVLNYINYNNFAVSAITSVSQYSQVTSNPAFTVQEAYSIDKKIDDGLPQSGTVQAEYITYPSGYNAGIYWAGTTNGDVTPAYTTSTPGTPTSCFDNGSGSGAQQYSMKQNQGNNLTCGLSFKFNNSN